MAMSFRAILIIRRNNEFDVTVLTDEDLPESITIYPDDTDVF
jgi:hypothetical protein